MARTLLVAVIPKNINTLPYLLRTYKAEAQQVERVGDKTQALDFPDKKCK